MGGKRRSGRANDRRAYACSSRCTPCPVITLEDIATYNGINWALNNNTAIIACQTLEIPEGKELYTNNFTLTNDGTINLNGTIRNTLDFGINDSITINNGVINIASTGVIAIADSGGIFTNNGRVFNNGYIFCQTYGVIHNNGRITNNNGGVFRINSRGIFNNNSVFINNGTIINAGDTGGNGITNNNNGATIINYSTIFNIHNGIINSSETDNGCGTGIINGTITGIGSIGTACPA